MTAAILATTLLLAGGCGAPSFPERFAALEVGTTSQQIVELLGEPDERREGEVPAGPYWGPSEGLASILAAGAAYHEWVWSRGGEDHYVWLAPTGAPEDGQWTVVQTAVYPTGAVFESSR